MRQTCSFAVAVADPSHPGFLPSGVCVGWLRRALHASKQASKQAIVWDGGGSPGCRASRHF